MRLLEHLENAKTSLELAELHRESFSIETNNIDLAVDIVNQAINEVKEKRFKIAV